jgi:hypothetical protein
MSDYGAACATIRTEVRSELARTCHLTGLRAGSQSEAIVESMVAMLHQPAIRWAVKAIIAKAEANS